MKINENLKKILAVFLIVFVVVLTIRYVKMLPVVLKVVVIACDVIAIYWAYIILKTKKNKNR